MCDKNCDFLKKRIDEIYNFIVDHAFIVDPNNEQATIEFFENNFVAFIQNHSHTCVIDSINRLVKYTWDDSLLSIRYGKESATLLDLTVWFSQYRFASKLFEYGADLNKTKDGHGFCSDLLQDAFGWELGIPGINETWNPNYDYMNVHNFFMNGPKTYAEYNFIENVLHNSSIFYLAKIISYGDFYYNILSDIFELLLEHKVNINYCVADESKTNISDSTISILIKLINESKKSKYHDDTTYRTLEIILIRYNFLLEGPGINYIDMVTGETLNVLEYAKREADNDKTNKTCERIVNYCNYRYTSDAVNEILPLPIAEEVVYHVVGNNGIIIKDNN